MNPLTLIEVSEGGWFSDGDWVESKDQDPTGSVRLTQLADVGIGHFRDRSDRWLREDQALRLACTFLLPDDVLIARMPDPLGRACIVPQFLGRAVTAVDVAILRVRRRDVDPRFVMWAINSPRFHQMMVARQSGTTRKRISRKNLASLSIPVPAIGEQRRIVEILEDHLSRLDAAERLLITSAQRGVALLRAAVDDVFDRSARSERWPVVTLGELASREPRSITDGPFGSNLARRHYRDQGARVVRLQNIADGVFQPSDAFISHEHYQTLSGHDVREGDVVVASLGAELPRAAVVPDLGGPAIVKADCIRVRPEQGVQPEWLVMACRATATKRWAKTVVHGVGRQRLGMAGIRAIPVPMPSSETRERVLARLMEVERSVDRMDHQVDLSRNRGLALRRALLEAAFTGRLTGSARDEETIEELAEA